MEIIAQYGSTLIMLAVVFGLFMAWGIGANDVANALGTSVGSGAITIKTAIIVAAIFEFAGAALAGGSVTRTIRKGIIDPSAIVDRPEILVYGMLAALLAAGCWLAVASCASATTAQAGSVSRRSPTQIGPCRWSASPDPLYSTTYTTPIIVA